MNVFDVGAYMPHGMCFLWRPDLLLLHVVSDAVVAAAYFSIPFALTYVLKRRGDFPFMALIRLFSAFIVACGLTHIASIVVIWYPMYGIEGLVKALAAGLSLATAIALVPYLPRIVSLRSPAELERVNAQLQAANAQLGDVNAKLQAAVAEAECVRLELAETALKLHTESVTDGLTQIANRRGFDVRLTEALADCRRSSGRASLLMIDIDNFKEFNDTFGHPEGDACLREVAASIRKCVRRPRDLVARFGGEEFAVIMEGTDFVGARFLAERIRSSISDLRVAQGAGARHPVVTVSIGVATADRATDLVPDLLLFRADQALYAAKAAGGDVVSAADASIAAA